MVRRLRRDRHHLELCRIDGTIESGIAPGEPVSQNGRHIETGLDEPHGKAGITGHRAMDTVHGQLRTVE